MGIMIDRTAGFSIVTFLGSLKRMSKVLESSRSSRQYQPITPIVAPYIRFSLFSGRYLKLSPVNTRHTMLLHCVTQRLTHILYIRTISEEAAAIKTCRIVLRWSITWLEQVLS